MNKTIEDLKPVLTLALEALEIAAEGGGVDFYAYAQDIREALSEPTTTENNGGKTGWPPGLLQDDCKGLSKWLSNRPDARRRVREALAEQPEQQPVAWRNEPWMIDYGVRVGRDAGDRIDLIFTKVYGQEFKLYAKDAAYLRYLLNKADIPGYTSPQPSKPWVGLTEEDREQHRNDWHSNIHDKEFDAIEDKLKEKNNG